MYCRNMTTFMSQSATGAVMDKETREKLLKKKGVPGYKLRRLLSYSGARQKKQGVKKVAKNRWKSLGKRLGLKR